MKKADLKLKSWKVFIFSLAALVHLILILTITIQTGVKEKRKDTSVFKLVDVEEYIPPKPIKEEEVLQPPKKIEPIEQIEVVNQDDIAEDFVETEKDVVEVDVLTAPVEIEYLLQHKISVAPGIPRDEILSRVIYPNLANRQKIEGVVYLELYIDSYGTIRDIKILKEPGYGLAKAAIDALSGIKCTPAMANGKPVAVRFRYSIRFKLK